MAKKALLMILDGWGIGKHGKGDVIYNTPTPYLDYLTAVSAHSELQASGENQFCFSLVHRLDRCRISLFGFWRLGLGLAGDSKFCIACGIIVDVCSLASG